MAPPWHCFHTHACLWPSASGTRGLCANIKIYKEPVFDTVLRRIRSIKIYMCGVTCFGDPHNFQIKTNKPISGDLISLCQSRPNVQTRSNSLIRRMLVCTYAHNQSCSRCCLTGRQYMFEEEKKSPM